MTFRTQSNALASSVPPLSQWSSHAGKMRDVYLSPTPVRCDCPASHFGRASCGGVCEERWSKFRSIERGLVHYTYQFSINKHSWQLKLAQKFFHCDSEVCSKTPMAIADIVTGLLGQGAELLANSCVKSPKDEEGVHSYFCRSVVIQLVNMSRPRLLNLKTMRCIKL